MSESGVPVRVEIEDILVGGECPMGLEVGRAWTVADGHVPEGMCASAWNSIMPFVTALRFGGTFPWSGEKEIRLTCPDAANPVVFHARVIDE
ncbi:MAG: TIGR04076 family protein [Coriobacteriia bacterium]|nr:TIGR04076 family protein [Coriobacteriia bacterium]